MCQFFSAIWTRDNRLLWHWATDHHSDLMALYGLDESREQHFVRCEFTPPESRDETTLDASNWRFRLDEERRPGWFDAEVEGECVKQLQRTLQARILNGPRKMVDESVCVLGPNAVADRLLAGRIHLVIGYAKIADAGYAKIANAGSATIANAGYATIADAGYAKIANAGYAKIDYAGSAKIDYAGYATIANAGYAKIANAGSATIANAGSAKIANAGSAKIDYAGSAKIDNAGSAEAG